MRMLQADYMQLNPDQKKPTLASINKDFLGYQAHHIIPKELCSRYLKEELNLILCDQAWNCIMLPNNSKAYVAISHSGSHPLYTEWIDSLLSPKNISGMMTLAPIMRQQMEEVNSDPTKVNGFKEFLEHLFENANQGVITIGTPMDDNDIENLFSEETE